MSVKALGHNWRLKKNYKDLFCGNLPKHLIYILFAKSGIPQFSLDCKEWNLL
ncbi:hypothetical protein AT1219_160012 [Vibrio alginolyticus]